MDRFPSSSPHGNPATGDGPAANNFPSYNTLPRLPGAWRSPGPKDQRGVIPDASMDNGTTFGDHIEYYDDDADEDTPLGKGLAGQLPRRNHTISSGTAGMRTKRLAQHFEQPLPPISRSTNTSPQASRQAVDTIESDAFHSPTIASPNRNSLREIAGAENEHDEWEKAILDERRSAADDLDSLPSTSALASNGAVRRHQSLNHHLGRSMASRLASSDKRPTPGHSPSTSRQHNTLSGALSPPSISTRLQDAFRMGSDDPLDIESFSASQSSPLVSKSINNTPWSNNTNGRLSPARPANGAPASSSPKYALKFDELGDNRRTPSPLANSTSGTGDLMNIHAFLQNMHLGNGTAPNRLPQIDTANLNNGIPQGGGDSASSASSQSKKLPSLITSPDALARSAKQHARQASDYDVHVGLMGGPVSASPHMPLHSNLHYPRGQHLGGHARIQSTDAVLSDGPGLPPLRSGPPPVSRSDAFAAPHTAAPVPTWSERDRIAGQRGSQYPGQSLNNLARNFDAVDPSAESASAHPGMDEVPLRYGGHGASSNTSSRGAIPSQWGLGLSPVAERNNRDQITYALSMALAEQQQKTAMLEAALRASGGMSSPPPGGMDQQYLLNNQRNVPYGAQGMQQQHFNHMNMNMTPPMAQFDGAMFGQQSFPPVGGRLGPQQGMPPFGGLFVGQQQQQQPQQSPAQQPPAIHIQHQQQAPAQPAKVTAKVQELAARLQLNPVSFELSPPTSSRFVVIKSFTEEDVHRSIRHGIWASTDKGNQRLDRIFKDCQREAAEAKHEGAAVYLFFSVNGSGHFCGLAEMTSAVDFNTSSDVWAQEGKWKGTFQVKHIYVKDVPNRELRHIPHPNKMEKKSVTQSRDTQELPRDTGLEMLKIIHSYPTRRSLLSGLVLDGDKEEGGDAVNGGGGDDARSSDSDKNNGDVATRFSAPGQHAPSRGGSMGSAVEFTNIQQPHSMAHQQPIMRFGAGPHPAMH